MTKKETPPSLGREVGFEAKAEDARLGMQLQAGYADERDLVNQLLGQIQMSRAISKFADVVSVSKLKFIKENKIYRAAAGQKGVSPSGEEIADVGTFEGFCKALGLSVSKVDEDIANLNAFGEEALDQLNAIGVGYRELRKYRKLPADAKTELIEAAKSGDKDTLLELAEDLIDKHIKEKTELETHLETLKADADAKDAVIAAKSQALDKALVRQAKLQKTTADEGVKTLLKEVLDYEMEAAAIIKGVLRDGFEQVLAHDAESSQDHSEVLRGHLMQLRAAVAELEELTGFTTDFENDAARQDFIKEHGFDPLGSVN